MDRLPGLDALRAYAACSIIGFHMVHAAQVQLPPPIEFLKNYLGFGVPLFFVVSAFSLAYGYLDNIEGRASVLRFYLKRFFRIAPLFYGMLVFQLVDVYFRYGMTKSVVEILASVTFTFNLIPRFVEGIVPASWSIGVEMVFYLVFPLIISFCRSMVACVLFCALSLFVTGNAYIDLVAAKELNPGFVYHGFLTCLPFFAFGLLFHRIYLLLSAACSRRDPRWRSGAGLISLVFGFFLFRYLIDYSPLYAFFWNKGLRSIWDALWSLPFGFICVGLALNPLGILVNPVTKYLGTISFSLYLTHPSIVHAMGKTGLYTSLYASVGGNVYWGFLIASLVTLTVVGIVSTLTFYAIERPGMKLGKRATDAVG